METKYLKTKRLTLKKMTMRDLDDFIEYKGDPNYYEFQPGSPMTSQKCKEKLENIIERYNNKDKPFLMWGIYFNNKLIGTISINGYNDICKSCSLAYGINKKFQRQGFAFEVSSYIIDFIFSTTDINRIDLAAWDGNIASQNLANKLGFIQEGVERQARVKNDKFFDVYHYGLLREDWENLKNKNSIISTK